MTWRSRKNPYSSLVRSTASTLPEIEVCSKTIFKKYEQKQAIVSSDMAILFHAIHVLSRRIGWFHLLKLLFLLNVLYSNYEYFTDSFRLALILINYLLRAHM